MHPELIELQALAAGILDPSRQRAVDEHLGSCAECARKYVEVFLGRSGQAPKRAATPAEGAPAAATPAAVTPVAAPPAVVAEPPALAVSALATPEASDVADSLVPAAPLVEEYGVVPLPPADVPPLPPQPWQGAATIEYVPPAPFGAPPTVPPAPAAAVAGLPDPFAQAKAGSARLEAAMETTPVLAQAIRNAGMTHIARALTPAVPQPAVVPITSARSAPAGASRGSRTPMLIGIAAAALLVIGGGGALAYRGVVSAAREEAVRAAAAAAQGAAPAPAATPAVAPAAVAPDSLAVAQGATADSAARVPAATTTSGGTVAAVTAPAPTAAPAAERRPARPAAPTPAAAVAATGEAEGALRQSRVALPSVSLDGVGDEAGADRLNARSTSRAAATDLQRSAGWATSRTAKP